MIHRLFKIAASPKWNWFPSSGGCHPLPPTQAPASSTAEAGRTWDANIARVGGKGRSVLSAVRSGEKPRPPKPVARQPARKKGGFEAQGAWPRIQQLLPDPRSQYVNASQSGNRQP